MAPVAMHPSIASTPMHQNVANSVQPTIATPPHDAMNDPTLARALVAAFSASQTMPPTLMPSTQPSNISNQLPSFSELSSLGPELDLMFQVGSMGMFPDWTVLTPQWNNNSLESNPFIGTGPTTVNMANQLVAPSSMVPTVEDLALATHWALDLPQVSPARSPQSRSNLPLLPPAPPLAITLQVTCLWSDFNHSHTPGLVVPLPALSCQLRSHKTLTMLKVPP